MRSFPGVATDSVAPAKKLPNPPVCLRLEPIQHPGIAHFLRTCPDFTDTMSAHRDTIFGLLYNRHSSAPPPHVDSITVVLKSMPGVAHTHGREGRPLDKEIHVSAEYVDGKDASEIYGVLLHELVHVWQHNGRGTAPGGFIEGLADFVRLRGGFGAAHWKRHAPSDTDQWDAGYERTAFFLEYLDDRYPACLARINARLRDEDWGDWVPLDISGGAYHDMIELFNGYKATFDKKGERPVPPARATHTPS